VSTTTCPVPHCDAKLGTTRNGNPYLLCPRHYQKLDQVHQLRLWRAYGVWRRLERTYLASKDRPHALLEARAIAISNYIDVRDDCIRVAGRGEADQLEVAL
jgi:hypothetical protein